MYFGTVLSNDTAAKGGSGETGEGKAEGQGVGYRRRSQRRVYDPVRRRRRRYQRPGGHAGRHGLRLCARAISLSPTTTSRTWAMVLCSLSEKHPVLSAQKRGQSLLRPIS